jgi:hypothetical protein
MSTYYDPLRFDRLDRQTAQRLMHSQMGPAREILAKHVDKGLELLGGWSKEAPKTTTSGVALRVFHGMLENVDATDVLVSSGAAKPARIQARTALEACAQLRYLLQRNDERISHSCMLSEHRHEIMSLESLIAERRTANAPQSTVDSLSEHLAQTRAHNVAAENRDHNALQAKRELDRLVEELGPEQVRWYMAFGGPRSVRHLFARAGMSTSYDSAFRPWSEVAHGRSARQRMGTTVVVGAVPFCAMRSSVKSDWAEVVSTVDSAVRAATREIVSYKAPARRDEYDRWLAAEIDVPLVRMLHPEDPAILDFAQERQFLARLPDNFKPSRAMRRAVERNEQRRARHG